MGSDNKHTTGMMLALAAVIIGGMVTIHGMLRSYRPAVDTAEMTYNMPRPKSSLFSWLFGLDGREIERREINPFKDKKPKDGLKAAAESVRKDQQKPKIETAKKPVQAAGQPIPAKQEKKVEVNIVNSAPERMSGDGEADNNPMAGSPQAYNPHAAQTVAAVDEDKKEDEMSAAQWRALVVGQPTKENVNKLINAFNNKKADSATYYLIMTDLISSSNPETQSMALYMAKAVPSVKSFSVVATNYEKLNAEGKKDADAYLLSYNQNARLGILASALQSQDSVVVLKAAHVVLVGLEKAKAGQPISTVDPRDARGNTVASNANVYKSFIPVFQQLQKSPDSNVSGVAQNALTQIQSLSNT